MINSKLLLLLSFLFFISDVVLSQPNTDKKVSINEAIPDNIYPPEDFTLPDFDDWTKGNYKKRIKEFKANPLEYGDIVFLGNSITEFGKDWGNRFNSSIIKNRGIAGDMTAGVLARLDEICYFKAKAVFLLIGVNDVYKNKTSEYIVENIIDIVNYIHTNSPETQVFVQTILPIYTKNTTLMTVNNLLDNYASSNNYTVINLYDIFANENDIIKAEYTTDGTHLTEAAYNAWVEYEKIFMNSVLSNLHTIQNHDLEFYPNPANETLTIKGLQSTDDYKYTIYSTNGKLMIEKEKLINHELDVSILPSGQYILLLENKTDLRHIATQFQKL